MHLEAAKHSGISRRYIKVLLSEDEEGTEIEARSDCLASQINNFSCFIDSNNFLVLKCYDISDIEVLNLLLVSKIDKKAHNFRVDSLG